MAVTEQIQEPIEVVAVFSAEGRLRPARFRWRGRVYNVTTINLTHKDRDGAAMCYFYAISCGADACVLRYHSERLEWMLWEWLLAHPAALLNV